LTDAGDDARAVVLTRLEIFRVSRGISVGDLIAESGISRQHLLRMRKGELQPRRDMIAAVVSALRQLSLEDVQPEDVIELTVEESGPWRRQRPQRLTADIGEWQRERDAAADLLAALPKMPPDDWLPFLEKRARSDSAVRALLFEGRRIIDEDPRHARALFHVATQLAERLTTIRREYRLALVGRAWLELANALRQLGLLREALGPLQEAERRFEGEPYCTKELGRAWLARGTILMKMGDLAGAEHYLACAVNIFAAVDDPRRIAKVRMVQAGVLFERSDFEGARSLWLAAVPALSAGRERHALPVAWLNLGLCDVEQNRIGSAKTWLEKALHAFERIRCEVEVLRTQWALARIEALFEDRKSGLAALFQLRAAFEKRGLLTDGGMVMLDATEALLIPPRRPGAAAQICNSLPQLFERAGATREARKAVVYLREAAAAHHLTVDDVRSVKIFIDRAEDGREASFVTPPKKRSTTRSERPAGPSSDG
jgi:tetratricopeptide (TPR) repeat protein